MPSIRTLFIFIYSHPYPPSTGGGLRYWQLINIMKKFGSIGVFFPYPGKDNSQTIPGVDLLHHYVLLHEDRSFWEKWERRFWWLYPRGYPPTNRPYTKTGAQEFQKVLAKFQPDLVIAEMAAYRYISLVNRCGCRFILDQHNLQVTWEQELLSASSGKNPKLTLSQKIENSLKISRVKSIERDLICKADQVWMCSALEDKQLQHIYGQVSHTYVVPNGIDVAYYDCVYWGQCHLPKGWEEKPRDVLYLGNMSYPPNIRAVNLLIGQIYPRLRQIYPDCRLLLVGGG